MTLENVKPHTQQNLDSFYEFLKITYADLFKNDPDYSFSASKTSPEALARAMTLGLDQGTSSKDGKAVKLACKHFGITHSYKAIQAFLAEK